MAIHLQNHWDESPEKHTVNVIGVQAWKDFQELVHRATNLWPDAPAHIKEFADMVTVGHVQQDYQGQDTSKSSPKKM